MSETSKPLVTDQDDPVTAMCEQVLPQTFPVWQAVGVRYPDDPEKKGLLIVANTPAVVRLIEALKKAGEDGMAHSIESAQSASFGVPREVM